MLNINRNSLPCGSRARYVPHHHIAELTHPISSRFRSAPPGCPTHAGYEHYPCRLSPPNLVLTAIAESQGQIPHYAPAVNTAFTLGSNSSGLPGRGN
jgi:hypothetical protein